MSGDLIRQALQVFLKRSQASLTPQPPRSTPGMEGEEGFTLIEMIVVIVIVTILAAIIGPSWYGFLRQRQVTVVRDEIYSILQTAQSEAKRTNLSRTVEFNSTTNTAEYKVYDPSVPGASSTPFMQLGGEKELEAGIVAVTLPNNLTAITFDYQGVPDYVTGATITQVEDLPANDDLLTITTSLVETDTDSQKRCVIIQTLLGGMRIGSGTDCN
ncbi:MAG: prepilin-type N-terminal cleavage/methylation domain-containing protein [Leptolyngbyaceae cyanobacterium MO_188.B28]|nr:prepilin-type N-terminal cleavage/methylation domain-containing protein [Leptolyngbyaceae cyanobacterium MO_188.B28]